MELNRSLQASRVVCISGLLTGIKTTNNENALGLAADPVWGGKSFERILVKQAEVSLHASISMFRVPTNLSF